ncbi:hypothetical protein EGR_03847 [Echinococcus granulosus]|uniref:Uncharacterized protein n=1 Tax=Echinococcus granulosus TaxID=6210 RepID=W6UJQ1_ECHGR|nr:hypothetical protein EGR_03847 [Echinococcus granulosus]EUB61361.1 hypothetical protein EGR_03847 [Echinococcus granulosus]
MAFKMLDKPVSSLPSNKKVTPTDLTTDNHITLKQISYKFLRSSLGAVTSKKTLLVCIVWPGPSSGQKQTSVKSFCCIQREKLRFLLFISGLLFCFLMQKQPFDSRGTAFAYFYSPIYSTKEKGYVMKHLKWDLFILTFPAVACLIVAAKLDNKETVRRFEKNHKTFFVKFIQLPISCLSAVLSSKQFLFKYVII